MMGWGFRPFEPWCVHPFDKIALVCYFCFKQKEEIAVHKIQKRRDGFEN